MASVNKVILIGNLGRDPEMRYSPDGKATCSLSLATSESWKDKDSGEKKERVEWHRVVFFGKAAEVLGEYTKKGGSLYVDGKLSTRKWTDKDGQARYTTEVIGDRFQFLGGGSRGEPAEQDEPAKPAASKSSSAAAAKEYRDAKSGAAPAVAAHKPGSFDDFADDIPF